MPYAFEAVVEGDNDNNNDNNNNNNGTNQGTIVAGSSMPEYMWIKIAIAYNAVWIFNGLLLTKYFSIEEEKNRALRLKNIPNMPERPYPPMPSYPYYYPPYGYNDDEDDEYMRTTMTTR